MASAPGLRIVAVEFRERPVRLRMPFRFGVVTLTEAPQAFVRVRVRLDDGREGWGAGAEILAPKWFDKNLALSNEDNFDQLRLALALARDAYLDGGARTAFGHFAAHYREVIEAGARRDLNPLVACFGPAQLDRAILDALCRLHRMSFYEAVQGNFAGIEPAAVAPDLAGFDIGAFLARLQPADTIDARHTVGLVDAIAGHPGQVKDGLPESLEEVVATYGHRWYKLKVGGNVDEDVRRLADIAAVLDASGRDYRASLDGNEQYDDLEALRALLARMSATPKLARLLGAIAFIEQPINRKHALDRDVSAVSRTTPVIVDESDADLDAFPRAKALGYSGVSSKMCKGLYKSILNAARCALWSAPAHLYLHDGRGSDDPGRSCRAAGPRAREPARDDARRAQRPSLCERHGGSARGRAGRIPRRAPGSLRAQPRCRPAAHPRWPARSRVARLRGIRERGGAGLA